MKLCFLAAANSIHSIRWIKYFADRGHDIHWVSLAPPSSEATELVKQVNFYEIKPSPLSDINGSFAIFYIPSAVLQLKKILNKIKPDVLHIHSAGTYGLVGTLSGFHPIILTPWGSDILLTSVIKKPLINYVIRKADTFTCDGYNTSQKLVDLGADQKRINLIRFGTDVEKFSVKGGSASGGKLKIISLRSLEPVYDIKTLIKAAAIVAKKIPNAQFIIAGDGSQKEQLAQLANKLNLIKSNFVRCIGRVDNTELPLLMQSADIYISTALSDSGLSASTAEAMATGLPVIVTDTGDNKEWITRVAKK